MFRLIRWHFPKLGLTSWGSNPWSNSLLLNLFAYSPWHIHFVERLGKPYGHINVPNNKCKKMATSHALYDPLTALLSMQRR
jgi:hypothetical protein